VGNLDDRGTDRRYRGQAVRTRNGDVSTSTWRYFGSACVQFPQLGDPKRLSDELRMTDQGQKRHFRWLMIALAIAALVLPLLFLILTLLPGLKRL
jgi:hypothetical protein